MKTLALATYLVVASMTPVLSVANAADAGSVTSSSASAEERDHMIQSAKAGNLAAQSWLGNYYAQLLPPDLAKARLWYTAAAEQGDAPAALWLGDSYREAAPRDFGDAYDWYQKAAKAGNTRARFLVAHMQEIGLGTEAQLESAIATYRQLAEKDYPNALFRLGMLHEFGVGVNKDPEAAAAYYARAKGRSTAARARTELALLPTRPEPPRPATPVLPPLPLKPSQAPSIMFAPKVVIPPTPATGPSPYGRWPCYNVADVNEWTQDRAVLIADHDGFQSAEIVIQVTVSGTGAIEYVEALRSSVASEGFKLLMTEAFYGLRCVASGERFVVKYPLTFKLVD